MNTQDDFYHEDGKYYCSHCGWWVPAGMEYLAADHNCQEEIDEQEVLEHAKKRLDGPTEQELQHIEEDIKAFKKYTNNTTTDDAKLFIDSVLDEQRR